MAGAEKTFEQGVAIGMLLGRSANGGGGSDYKLKDPLLQYILDNAKLVATCQLGEDYIIKYYAGVMNFNDPNAHLFYRAMSQGNIIEASPKMSFSGSYGLYVGQEPTKTYGLISGISQIKGLESGIFGYWSKVVFKGDAPLFGDITGTLTSYSYVSYYGISKDNDGSGITKDIYWYYPYTYYCTEEDIENIQYLGDFKWMFKVTIDTDNHITNADGEETPVTRAKWTYQLQTLAGEDVDHWQEFQVTYHQINYTPKQYTCMWTDPDTGETKEIMDNTRPPRIVETGRSDRSYNMSAGFLMLPPVEMLGVMTQEQIKNEVPIMYNQMIRSSTIGDTGYITGLVNGPFLEPEPTQ